MGTTTSTLLRAEMCLPQRPLGLLPRQTTPRKVIKKIKMIEFMVGPRSLSLSSREGKPEKDQKDF